MQIHSSPTLSPVAMKWFFIDKIGSFVYIEKLVKEFFCVLNDKHDPQFLFDMAIRVGIGYFYLEEGRRKMKIILKRHLFVFVAMVVLITLFPFNNTAHSENLTIDTNTTWDLDEYTYDDVLITNNATLTFDGAVTLNATNLTIDVGSAISADYKGYPAGQGPGAGEYLICGTYGAGSGGGYGGRGGDVLCSTGGGTYGSSIAPEELGSGGGNGGAGGGAIKLVVTGTLTNDGIITANGAQGTRGGGSGGSVYVITKMGTLILKTT